MAGPEQDKDQGRAEDDPAAKREPEPQRDGRDWIDTVADLSKWIGLNPVRVRWKLANWRRRRGHAQRRREQHALHVRYQHKTCDSCGAVQDRDATVCSRCGERLGGRRFQVLRRMGILAPQWLSMSSLLGFAFVLAFARVLLASQGGFGDVFGLKPTVLFEHGGNFAPAIALGEYWRWLTACFLHGGLIHLGFNLFALAVVGPQVESLYGRLQMLFLFVATGVVASIGSTSVGPVAVGIGASGGIMGLVGVAAGWGHREGTTLGHTLRNDMLKWSAYVFIFGFFIGADNWAHLFGLLAGLAFGYSVRPRTWKTRGFAPLRAAAGVVGAVAAIAALGLIVRPPGMTAAGMDEAAGRKEMARRLEPYAEMCRLHWQGDDAGALERMRALNGAAGKDDAAELRPLCDGFISMRNQCRSGAEPPPELGAPGPDAREQWSAYCEAVEEAFASAPALPTGSATPSEGPGPLQ
jgi:rhomboid protease GluP